MCVNSTGILNSHIEETQKERISLKNQIPLHNKKRKKDRSKIFWHPTGLVLKIATNVFGCDDLADQPLTCTTNKKLGCSIKLHTKRKIYNLASNLTQMFSEEWKIWRFCHESKNLAVLGTSIFGNDIECNVFLPIICWMTSGVRLHILVFFCGYSKTVIYVQRMDMYLGSVTIMDSETMLKSSINFDLASQPSKVLLRRLVPTSSPVLNP